MGCSGRKSERMEHGGDPTCRSCRRIRMPVCEQCQDDHHLKLHRRDGAPDGEPGWICTQCGTWMIFGALPPKTDTRSRAASHKDSPGLWPADFPIDEAGKVEEGLVVRSKSGDIEGRTTGDRRRCTSVGC